MTLSIAVEPHENARLYPAYPLLAVSLAVFREDRVLLAKRARPPMAGLFTLPGGLVELGETLGAAARRELAEEVGIVARVVGFNRHVEVIERDGEGTVARHYVIASFVGRWVEGEATTGPEVAAILWATRADLENLPTTPGLVRLLDAAWAMIDHAVAQGLGGSSC